MRAAGVLRAEGVHDGEDDFRAKAGIGVEIGDGLCATFGMGEAAPVVHVGHGHVVERAGHAAAAFVGEHGDVDDLGDLAADDAGEVARRTDLIGGGDAFAVALAGIAEKEVAPDEFAERGGGDRRFAIVARDRRDAADLEAIAARGESCGAQFGKRAVPDDDARGGHAGFREAGGNGFHDSAMRGEVTSASRANFDADHIRRRDEGAPRFRHLGLLGDGEDELIDHAPGDGGVFLELIERRGVGGDENRGGRGDGHWSSLLGGTGEPGGKEECESDRQRAKHGRDYWRRAAGCQWAGPSGGC